MHLLKSMIMILKRLPINFKTKKILNKLIDKKQGKISNLNEKTDFNNLIYNFKDKRLPKINFNNFDKQI